ncbi:hypothetical protein FB451DRAFT_1405497 [Mycena latifolia]|nr:hypothetical protein FB451DRAFT_1405497 [Mycena latifolia]
MSQDTGEADRVVIRLSERIVESSKSRQATLELRNGSTLTYIDTVVLATRRILPSPPPPKTVTLLTSAYTAPTHPCAVQPRPLGARAHARVRWRRHVLADIASTWLALVLSTRLPIPDSLDARLAGERMRIAKVERAHTKDEQRYAQALCATVAAVALASAAVLPEWSHAD